MSNFGELKTAYFDHLQITPTSGHVDLSEGERHLNEAMRELHSLIAGKFEGFFETSALLNEVSGATEIALPTNLLRINRLRRLAGHGASATNPLPMHRVARSNADTVVSTTAADYGVYSAGQANHLVYYPRGQKMIVLVIPAAANRTGSLELFYTYRPATMTADAHTPYQEVAGAGGAGLDNLEDWHHLIWMRACLKAMSKEDDMATYQMHKQNTAEAMEEMWMALALIDQSPRYMTVPEDQHPFFD